jgi:sugar phosphate permease
MKKVKKIFRELSFKLDALFFRNLTLILATILIWRGVWNFADKYFWPNDFIASNIATIVIGVFLLFLFDAEIEETEEEIENTERYEARKNHRHKHRHLLNEQL